MSKIKGGICLVTKEIEDCDGNITEVKGIPVFVENIVNTKECESKAIDRELACISNDGGSTIVTGAVTYDFTNPAAPIETIYFGGADVTGTYVKVPCDKNIDNETKDVCRTVTVAGAWGAIGDKVSISRVFDVTTDINPTFIYSFITNETTGVDLTGVVTEMDVLANSSGCDNGCELNGSLGTITSRADIG